MKNKSKILLAVGLIAFALVCVFGGQELAKRAHEQRLAELQAQQSQNIESPVVTPENVVYTLPPAAAGSSTPAVDDVNTDEEGNQVITPDFENQGNEAANVVDPGVQVTANVGGGGGTVPMESDGAYHGESQPPAATPSPAPSAPPASTPKPTATPKPTEKTVDANGKPTWIGYDGEEYGDWEWLDAGSLSDWYNRNSTDGGTGGDDSDVVTGGLSGEKVGSFG